jgi:LacI family transcriptional regulator
MRVTIKDVSALAGVSIKTVSRVLNKEKYVRTATREKVEAAVKALNFSPSLAARALAGKRSHQIALIYDNHSPFYIHQIQEGIWAGCREQGVRMLAQPADVASLTLVEEVGGLIDQTHVDGIILSSPVTDSPEVLAELERRGIPFVRISPGTNHAMTSSVYMDDVQAADDMTTHLINLGHRRIGFIIGHPNHMASDQRLFGYRRALDRAVCSIFPAARQRRNRCSICPIRRQQSSPAMMIWPPVCSPWRTAATLMCRALSRLLALMIRNWRARCGRR